MGPHEIYIRFPLNFWNLLLDFYSDKIFMNMLFTNFSKNILYKNLLSTEQRYNRSFKN